MADLFDWLKHSSDHLLIRSCVFHYEFEFIHPFTDGNGRMGRLWQSLILNKPNPIFEHLPVENIVYANQQQYYDAISASSAIGQSGPFIDFMLGEIQKTLKTHKGNLLHEVPNKVPNKLRRAFPNLPCVAWNIYALLKDDGSQTSAKLAEQTGISERMVKKHISKLKEVGLLTRIGSNKTEYWKTNG